MQTLLIISASAFGLAALVWFSTWAFWIHPPEGWIGSRILSVNPLPETNAVRRAAWFRSIRIATLILGLTTVALFSGMLAAHF